MKSTTKGADMTTETPMRYEIGSREDKIDSLAKTMRRHADVVNVLADEIEEWGWNPTARRALGLMEQGEQISRDARRIFDSMVAVGVGRSTQASYRNEACSVGAGGGLNDRGAIGYGLLHALGEVEKIEDGTYNRVEWRQSKAAVKASGMRCHASNCRVIAGMLDDLAAGKIWGIR